MKILNFDWQTRDEKIRRYARISPKKKLEWLEDMLAFINKTWSNKQKKLYFKIREAR